MLYITYGRREGGGPLEFWKKIEGIYVGIGEYDIKIHFIVSIVFIKITNFILVSKTTKKYLQSIPHIFHTTPTLFPKIFSYT